MQKILNFIKKVLKFLKSYLFKDPIFVILYGINYFRNSYKVNPKFYSESEVIEKIKSGYSYIRYGDGEMIIIKGGSIDYQKANQKLGKDLKKTIIDYKKNSKYILAIPERYVLLSNLDLKAKNKIDSDGREELNMFRCWLPFKIDFSQYFPKDMYYADAHSFYVSGFFENNFKDYFKNKKVIIVTTQKNIDKQKQNIEKNLNVLSWVPAKSPDPYDDYNKYMREIDKIIKNENKNDIILLLGAGPASKPLAYHYANLDIQSMDVGHGFEYFYQDEGLDSVLM